MDKEPVVLYIEDNDDNRKLVYRVLKAAGIHVDGVSDGVAGLNYISRQIPDIVLIDINLPEIDGYTIVTKLRQEYGLIDLPILALTAHALKEDEERCLEAGCNGYIPKPINVDTLPMQVLDYLSNKSVVR